MGIPVGFVFGRSLVCVCKVYLKLTELNETLDSFVVRSVDFPEIFRITPCFFRVEAVMSLMSPILGSSGAVPRFFSFSLFIACIVLVAHNIVQLQSERAFFCM